MILRRIIAHFRKQEWTAGGIDLLIAPLSQGLALRMAATGRAESSQHSCRPRGLTAPRRQT